MPNTALNGHVEIVKFLFETYNVNPDPKNINGNTPLHVAALNGRTELVRFLVEEHNADITCTNNKEETPLHLAIRGNHVAVVKYLTTQCKEALHCKDKQRFSDFDMAIKNQRLEILAYFIQKGITGKAGNTPLHLAAVYGYSNLVKILVEQHGVDIACKNLQGATAFDCVLETVTTQRETIEKKNLPAFLNMLAAIEYLSTQIPVKDQGNTALHYEAMDGNISDVIGLANNYSEQITTANNIGNTPLHLASAYGHLEVVKFLISQHNNSNVKNKVGNTPVQFAAFNGHLLVVKYLVETCHADPSVQT